VHEPNIIIFSIFWLMCQSQFWRRLTFSKFHFSK